MDANIFEYGADKEVVIFGTNRADTDLMQGVLSHALRRSVLENPDDVTKAVGYGEMITRISTPAFQEGVWTINTDVPGAANIAKHLFELDSETRSLVHHEMTAPTNDDLDFANRLKQVRRLQLAEYAGQQARVLCGRMFDAGITNEETDAQQATRLDFRAEPYTGDAVI